MMDMHVHSTFSDGAGTVEENARMAISRGVRWLGCVDHVRRDTDWVPEYIAEVARVQRRYPELRITAGIEAKLLDEKGTLDMPALAECALRVDRGLRTVDFILAADHRFPLGNACLVPREVIALRETGAVSDARLLQALVDSTIGAMERYPRVILAHLFSILPKVGMAEHQVTDEALAALARTARATGALVEVSERWRCPGQRALRAFRDAGVTILASTDAHTPDAIADYTYVAEQLCALGAPARAREVAS